jgi:hypothetical protein
MRKKGPDEHDVAPHMRKKGQMRANWAKVCQMKIRVRFENLSSIKAKQPIRKIIFSKIKLQHKKELKFSYYIAVCRYIIVVFVE